jgi:hypothetical protein
MGTKGIYSFADIERQRAAVLFPVEFRAITRTIASAAGGYGQNSQHLNLMSLLNPADLKSALASYWYEFEGAFRIFGAYSGAILMVIAFYKILTQVFGGGVHCAVLSKMFGKVFGLLGFFCPNLASLFVIYGNEEMRSTGNAKATIKGTLRAYAGHRKNNTVTQQPSDEPNYPFQEMRELQRQEGTASMVLGHN